MAKAPIELTELEHLDEAVGRVAGMADLPANWDSYGATPILAHAIATASALVTQVATARLRIDGTRIAPILVAPIADGEVQVEWQGPLARIEVQIAPDGTLGYLVATDAEEERGYDEADDVPIEDVMALVLRILAAQPIPARWS